MSGPAGGLKLYGGLSLRSPQKGDEQVMMEMFVASRPWLSHLAEDRDFRQMMVEQQYSAIQAGHEGRYPDHLDFLIEKMGQVVGRVVINLGYQDWRVAELHVHALARGKGIGSDLMRSLQAAAANARMPLTLSVLVTQPRQLAFYQRLGFRIIRSEPVAHQMGWFPPGHPLAAPAMAG